MLAPGSQAMCGSGGLCLVQVSHDVTPNQVPCAAMPLPSHNTDVPVPDRQRWQAPQCQRFGFQVEALSTSNPLLLKALPSVDDTGTLHLALEPSQTGTAHFRLALLDEGPHWQESESKTLTINVLPVNEPPRFNLMTAESVFIYQEGGLQSVVFATNVTASEVDQLLSLIHI